ncbi:hypothetical protein Ancab_029201, partial [Ancistrocladus abbreviatus]
MKMEDGRRSRTAAAAAIVVFVWLMRCSCSVICAVAGTGRRSLLDNNLGLTPPM